jgi:hypothetical protein
MGNGEIIRELAAKLGLEVDENAFEVAHHLFGLMEHGLAGIGILAGSAATALAGMVGGTIAMAVHLDHLAAKTGLNVEEMQRFGLAATLGGVGMEELSQALSFAARKGVKDLPKFMQDSADQIKKLNEEGHRSEALKLAFDRFGRAGRSILPMLQEGGAGLREMMTEADDLGTVMSAKLVKLGENVGANFEKMTKAALGFAYSISEPLLYGLRDLTHSALEWWKANRVATVEKVKHALQTMLDVIHALVGAWKMLAVVIGSVVIAALIGAEGSFIAAGKAAVVAAYKAIIAWGSAALPILLLGLIIAGVILAVQDLWTSFTGGQGVLEDLFYSWDKFYKSILEHHPGEWWLTGFIKDALMALTDLEGTWNRIQSSGLLDIAKALLQYAPGFAGTGLFTSGGASSPAAAAALQTQAAPVGTGTVLQVGGIHITQRPGESSEDLARLVRIHLDDLISTQSRETAASMGPVP